jgi:hypothetical protein
LLLRHAGLDEARHAPAGVGELGGIHDGSPVNEDQGAIRGRRWWSSAFARETKIRRELRQREGESGCREGESSGREWTGGRVVK